jgi:hypothetical protein
MLADRDGTCVSWTIPSYFDDILSHFRSDPQFDISLIDYFLFAEHHAGMGSLVHVEPAVCLCRP